MVYIRGHSSDYDDWASAGNAGWSYAEVLPYFKKSEDNLKWRNSPFHGHGGLMGVVDPDHVNPLTEVFFAAAKAIGIPYCADFNGAVQDGYGLRQMTMRGGRRESTAKAFLRPARQRENLTVLTDTLVNRVVIESTTARAVEVLHRAEKRTIYVRREVVLSAGTIESPLILNRSGVGNADELQEHGIDVVHCLPGVGKNYQDHVCAGVNYTSPRSVSYGISLRSLPRLALSPFKYAAGGRGLLAIMPMNSGIFHRTKPGLTRPDIQIIYGAIARTVTGGVGIGHGYAGVPVVLRPKSRGSVKLGGASPLDHPAIDPNLLAEPEDNELLLDALELNLRIFDDPAFDPYRGEERAPGRHIRSRPDLARYVRNTAFTAYHPAGTCKMGTDTEAVVDPELRVHGIAGLRVADASVMPTLIGGNTNAPVIMIAEKAADMIRGLPPLPRTELP
jgi:choline dehydrogenase-like flavoprotein